MLRGSNEPGRNKHKLESNFTGVLETSGVNLS